MAKPVLAFSRDDADAAAMPEPQDYANYMVFKDGRPFLIVNATRENVDRLVHRFALYEAESDWSYAAHAA